MLKEKIVLLFIFIIACFFRLNNLNWDNNHHLHPDERFLTMVSTSMKMPENFHMYLDPNTSTFNPVNVGHTFFVYGVFPVVLNKLLAVQLGSDDYNAITLQGRALSAVADLIVLVLVYKITKLLFSHEKEKNAPNIAIWATFFYAIAVLPIQLSHFFAADTFVTTFAIASFYCALVFYYRKGVEYIFLSGLMWGIAVACKVSALYLLPLNLAIIILSFWNNPHTTSSFFIALKQSLKKSHYIVGLLTIFVITAYLTLRFANPYYFADSNFFNLSLNDAFVQNIKSLEALMRKDIWFPPMVQWFNKIPMVFSFVNIAFFGLGLPFAILMFIGCFITLRKEIGVFIEKKYSYIPVMLVIIVWSIFFFLYQSMQLAQTIRYFIFLFPLFSLYAAIAVTTLLARWEKIFSKELSQKKMMLVKYSTQIILLILVLIWPIAFSSIYLKPHSRVQATEWIYDNIEHNSVVLFEHWDDILPLNTVNRFSSVYQLKELPVFGEDTDAKWVTMDAYLNEGDYYILSSNRGWGSIMSVPERYPRMSKFYEDLLHNKTNYKLVKEFTSHPQVCLFFDKICLTFDDQWAEESFTVYDHPQVLIFKKSRNGY